MIDWRNLTEEDQWPFDYRLNLSLPTVVGWLSELVGWN